MTIKQRRLAMPEQDLEPSRLADATYRFDVEVMWPYYESHTSAPIQEMWDAYLKECYENDEIPKWSIRYFSTTPFQNLTIPKRTQPKQNLVAKAFFDSLDCVGITEPSDELVETLFAIHKKKMRDFGIITLKTYSVWRKWVNPSGGFVAYPAKVEIARILIRRTNTYHKYSPETISVREMDGLRKKLEIL